MLLAQAVTVPVTVSQSDLDQALFLFKLLASVGMLFGIVVRLLKVVDFFRHKPPLHSEFATKAELAQLRNDLNAATERLSAAHGSIFAKLDDIAKSVNQSFNQMFRDVGKLEGRDAMLQTLKGIFPNSNK